jgi:K+-transporting ATPase ATPase C chain
MLRTFRDAFAMLIALTLVTGVAYPRLVTGIAKVAFPSQAEGSLIVDDGRLRGSALVGQPFTDPKYFWGRPSGTAPMPYNAGASQGTNQGPMNPAFAEAVKARLRALRTADPGNAKPVPVDLVTASGSGLDPHVSPAAADYQVERVARARGLDPARVRALVAEYIQDRQLGILGEPRVNVLALNLALDRTAK